MAEVARRGAMSGLGIRRLQHLVLWVADVGRSERFYRDVLGFEVAHRYPQAAVHADSGERRRPQPRPVRAARPAPPDEGARAM